MDDTTQRLRSLGGALLLAALLGAAGCSSSQESGSDTGTVGLDARNAEAGESAAREAPQAEDALAGAPDRASLADGDAEAGTSVAVEPAVIQTGTLTVQSDDVGRARFDLGKVVDAHGGSIADERTTASSEGEVRLSRVQLRVPSEEFDAALADLADLGEVTASTRKAQDVTGEVIDTRARIRAQEQSLARVEVLFARAQDIRDIVAIEAQLSRRQAELDSLKGQLAYLEDQTSLATITVYLEQAPEAARVGDRDDDSAFVRGLRDGWHALGALGARLAAVTGALLPFAVLALLLGAPTAVVLRRWQARHPRHRPATEV